MQAIVKLDNYMEILAPTTKAATDLIALLARCTRIQRDWEAAPPGMPAVYKQESIEVTMTVTAMRPHTPKAQPSAPRTAKGRTLPAPTILELPYNG